MTWAMIGKYIGYVAEVYKSFLFSAIPALGLLAWLLVAYCRSRQPKSGSLEWIREYDKPKLTLTEDGSDFSGKDIFFAVCAGAGAVLLMAAFLWMRSLFTGRGFAGSDSTWSLFKKIFDCLIGGAGMYLLTRSMFREHLPALFAGALFGIASNADFAAEGFLVWSMFFLWKWLRQDNSAPFFEAAGWMFGTAVMFALHLLYTMSSLWLVPLYAAAWIAKLCSRAKSAAAGRDVTPIGLSIFLTFVLIFLAGLALWFAALIRCRDATIIELRTRIFSLGNYREILSYVPEMISRLFLPLKAESLKHLLVKLPLVAGGLAGLVCALIGFIKRNETEAISVVALGVLICLEWAFTGTALLAIAFLPALCYLWSSLWSRKDYLPVCIFAGGMLVFHYLNWLIMFSKL